MLNRLYLFPIFLCLVGCAAKNNKVQFNSAELFGSILIPLDTNFSPNVQRTQLLSTDSGEFLALMNKVDASIVFFSLEEKKQNFVIPLSKDGPNRIGVDNGFHIVAQDCLLLATIPPKILVVNFQGEIEKSIPVRDPNNLVNYLSSTNETPFLFGESSIFGAQPFFQNIYRVKDSDIQNSQHIYKVKLEKTNRIETKWLDVYRPDDTWKNGKKSMDFTWMETGDTILVSPHTDHRLWVVSKKEEKVLSYPSIKSRNVNSFRIIKEYPVGDQGIIETLENDQYDLILYDPFRNVIYRFYFLKIDLTEFSKFSPRELYANRPKMGVMVLDQNLEILGEHVFENFQVEPWNYFVGKKGLYVSTNNPNRDDFDENFLRYDIIRFEGLKYED